MRQGWGGIVPAAVLAALLFTPGQSGATRIRPGTISLGGQIEYSGLYGGTYLARAFDQAGVGFAVKVRYRMRNGFVLGATFTEQFYHPSRTQPFVQSGDSSDVDKLSVVTAGLELGRVFGSTEHPYYFLIGAGVWSPTAFPVSGLAYEKNKTDRLYLSGTLGTEIFFRRSVTVDLSLRGLIHADDQTSYFYPGDPQGPTKLDHELQMAAGVHFYVLD
ncbi:MAG TPA: hypothetical protein VMS93_09020 [Candidatus Saccharimonadales bacterium]|nr:hypothetical protein [Candidatus Saccharimonadales bacterium]